MLYALYVCSFAFELGSAKQKKKKIPFDAFVEMHRRRNMKFCIHRIWFIWYYMIWAKTQLHRCIWVCNCVNGVRFTAIPPVPSLPFAFTGWIFSQKIISICSYNKLCKIWLWERYKVYGAIITECRPFSCAVDYLTNELFYLPLGTKTEYDWKHRMKQSNEYVAFCSLWWIRTIFKGLCNQ